VIALHHHRFSLVAVCSSISSTFNHIASDELQSGRHRRLQSGGVGGRSVLFSSRYRRRVPPHCLCRVPVAASARRPTFAAAASFILRLASLRSPRSCLQHDLLSCCCCRRFLILIGLGSGAMARLRSGSQLGSSCSLTRVSSARASRLVNVDLGQPWLSRTVRLVSRLRLNFGL
jgi:hypothetical protein